MAQDITQRKGKIEMPKREYTNSPTQVAAALANIAFLPEFTYEDFMSGKMVFQGFSTEFDVNEARRDIPKYKLDLQAAAVERIA